MLPKRLIILSIFAALAAANTEPSSAQWVAADLGFNFYVVAK